MKKIRVHALLLSSIVTCTCAVSMIRGVYSPVFARGQFDKSTAAPADDNLRQGLNLMRQGNYDAAIDSFLQAIYFSRNQYNPEAYKYLGLSYKATRQYAKAAEALQTCSKQDTEPNPDVEIDLAEIYMNLGEWGKAQDQLQLSCVRNSAKHTARQRYTQGQLYERMADIGRGDIGAAWTMYHMAIFEKPNYTLAWMAQGRTEVKQKKYKEALQTYRTILEKGPLLWAVNYEELYCNMGICLLQHGDHQGALDHWRLALESNPNSYTAHLALANMFADEKHFSSASKEYQAALRNVPEGSEARNQIMRRLQWLDQQTAPKEAPIEIRPSPSMRHEFDQGQNEVPQQEVPTNAPASKESGF